jgi:hypothetical protein
MAYSQEQLMTALRNADAAGDIEAAKKIARMIKGGTSETQEVSTSAPTTGEVVGISPKVSSRVVRDDDGDRVFNNLLEDDRYSDALKKWGGNDGRSLEELREDSFEYFNSSMNNEASLIHTAVQISQMDDSQKDNLKYLYDAYNETAITGEGSRSGWEQTKDAIDLLWAPSTWLGGKFIAAPALKAASKAAMKQAFKRGAKAGLDRAGRRALVKESIKQGVKDSAKRSGFVAGGIVGGHDAAMQTQVEMKLNPEQEYSAGRTAFATGAGAFGGRYLPTAAKYAGNKIRQTGKALSGTVDSVLHPIKTIKGAGDSIVEAVGGAKAAETGVVLEAEKAIGSGSFSQGAETALTSAKTAIKAGYDSFKTQYQKFGNLTGASMKSFNQLADKVIKNKYVSGMGDVANIKKLVNGGEITVSEGMRKMRSALGRATAAASNPNNVNSQSKGVLQNLQKESRVLFTEAAKKSGFGDEVKALDAKYSEFLTILNKDRLKPLNTKGDPSEIMSHMKQVISETNPSKSKIYLDEIKRISELTGQPELLVQQKQALGEILGEKLFTGNNATSLRKYLSEPGGKEVLKRVYPALADDGLFNRLENITKKASRSSKVGVYIMRVLGGMGASMIGGGTASPLSAGLAGVGGLTLADKFITSKWFMDKAMKVFAKPPKAARRESTMLAKEMVRRGYSMDKINATMDSILGVGVWAGFMQTDTSEDIGREIASMAKGGAASASVQANVLLTQELPEFMGQYFK